MKSSTSQNIDQIMETKELKQEFPGLNTLQRESLLNFLGSSKNRPRYFDYYFASRETLIISPKVRLKCIYGCPNYNVAKKCPPEDTLTFEQCKSYLETYQSVLYVRFKPLNFLCPKDAQDILLELEREAMLVNLRFALAIFPKHCDQCSNCKKGTACKDPSRSRGSVSSFCIDIMGSLEKMGLPQKILQSKDDVQEWYYTGIVMLQ